MGTVQGISDTVRLRIERECLKGGCQVVGIEVRFAVDTKAAKSISWSQIVYMSLHLIDTE